MVSGASPAGVLSVSSGVVFHRTISATMLSKLPLMTGSLTASKKPEYAGWQVFD
jgi:hypothetical protein